jgi:hypothetical protein
MDHTENDAPNNSSIACVFIGVVILLPSCCLAKIGGYVGMLISLWLFLFAAQPKEFFLDRLKKLEQQSHKHVEIRGEHVE